MEIISINKLVDFNYSHKDLGVKTSPLGENWIKDDEFSGELNLLIKRFEVTRKIYIEYNQEFRPSAKDVSYKNIDLYLQFSYVLICAFRKENKLQYLNALLKVNDIIIGNKENVCTELSDLLVFCLEAELKIVSDLRERLK